MAAAGFLRLYPQLVKRLLVFAMHGRRASASRVSETRIEAIRCMFFCFCSSDHLLLGSLAIPGTTRALWP